MKNKLGLFVVWLVVFIILTIPVLAQSIVSDAEKALKNANDLLDVATKNYEDAKQSKSDDKIQEAKIKLREALDFVDSQQRIRDYVVAQQNTQQQTVTEASPKPSPSPIPTTTTTPSPTLPPPPAVSGQTIDDCTNRKGVFSQRICNIASEIVERSKNTGKNFRINIGDNPDALLTVIYGQIIYEGNIVSNIDDPTKKFILDAEDARTDKQIGADANSKGTTSIVVKGGVPSVLNFAFENGAAARSISGTTVTFRVNPAGFYETLKNQNYINYIDKFRNGFVELPDTNQSTLTDSKQFRYGSKPTNYFRKLSVGLSFDTSRGQATPLLTGSERQLSSFSFRYEFLNERDPRHPKYADELRNLFTNEGGRLIANLTAAEMEGIFDEDFQFQNKEIQKWVDQKLNPALQKLPKSSSISDVEAEVRKQLKLLPFDAIKSDAPILIAFSKITKSYGDFNSKEKELLNKIAKAPLITFEYTNYREPILPDTHNLNFIFEKGIPLNSSKDSPVMDVTFNGSLTFFNRKPTEQGTKRIKDFSFAGQLDLPLGGINPKANFYGTVFSFAGKYQRLTGNAMAFDGTVFPNTKGDIWLGQAKLTIPLDKFGLTGVKFPISATFANRTELVRESQVRGNFGFTLDLDKVILSHLLKSQ